MKSRVTYTEDVIDRATKLAIMAGVDVFEASPLTQGDSALAPLTSKSVLITLGSSVTGSDIATKSLLDDEDEEEAEVLVIVKRNSPRREEERAENVRRERTEEEGVVGRRGISARKDDAGNVLGRGGNSGRKEEIGTALGSGGNLGTKKVIGSMLGNTACSESIGLILKANLERMQEEEVASMLSRMASSGRKKDEEQASSGRRVDKDMASGKKTGSMQTEEEAVLTLGRRTYEVEESVKKTCLTKKEQDAILMFGKRTSSFDAEKRTLSWYTPSNDNDDNVPPPSQQKKTLKSSSSPLKENSVMFTPVSEQTKRASPLMSSSLAKKSQVVLSVTQKPGRPPLRAKVQPQHRSSSNSSSKSNNLTSHEQELFPGLGKIAKPKQQPSQTLHMTPSFSSTTAGGSKSTPAPRAGLSARNAPKNQLHKPKPMLSSLAMHLNQTNSPNAQPLSMKLAQVAKRSRESEDIDRALASAAMAAAAHIDPVEEDVDARIYPLQDTVFGTPPRLAKGVGLSTGSSVRRNKRHFGMPESPGSEEGVSQLACMLRSARSLWNADFLDMDLHREKLIQSNKLTLQVQDVDFRDDGSYCLTCRVLDIATTAAQSTIEVDNAVFCIVPIFFNANDNMHPALGRMEHIKSNPDLIQGISLAVFDPWRVAALQGYDNPVIVCSGLVKVLL